MPKASKIKGSKFTLPWKSHFKIQNMFDNNTMELTISDEGVKIVNINKLKVYHHNPPTSVIIADVIVDTRPSSKIGNRHRKRTKLNFPPKLHTKPKNLPWIDPKPRKTFNENDIEWIGEEDSRSCIRRMFKNVRTRKFCYEGGKKGTISLYSRNHVKEEKADKNRKVGLEPKLARAKKPTHYMLNMPMNEPRHVWPLEQLLCPQELAKLKGIKHKYHVWKDYLERNNERIDEWSARAREVRERKIHSKVIATKQQVPKDFLVQSNHWKN
jgi:hypothetical protein